METLVQANSDLGSSCAILIGQLILEELRCLRKEIKEEVQRIADKFQDYIEAGKNLNAIPVPLEPQSLTETIDIEEVHSCEADVKSEIVDGFPQAEIDLRECFHDIEIPHMPPPNERNQFTEEQDVIKDIDSVSYLDMEDSATLVDVVNANGEIVRKSFTTINNAKKQVNGKRTRKSHPRKFVNLDSVVYSESEDQASSHEEKLSEDDSEKWMQYATIDKDLFFCNCCNISFTQRSSLKRHCRVHTGEKPFKCESCDKAFPRLDDLKLHRKREHRSLPQNVEVKPTSYEAEKEQKVAKNTLEIVQDHKKTYSVAQNVTTVTNQSFEGYGTHNTEQKRKSNGASVKFILPLKHQKNIKLHNGRKFYHCDVCYKSFVYTSQSYRRHMMIHTGERPFKCEFCNKGFIRAANMKMHVRIHTGEKPYKCHLCSKTFRNRTGLNNHLRTVHATDGDLIHWV